MKQTVFMMKTVCFILFSAAVDQCPVIDAA